jgi:hypothetical protein
VRALLEDASAWEEVTFEEAGDLPAAFANIQLQPA